jgi:hypothetical protein
MILSVLSFATPTTAAANPNITLDSAPSQVNQNTTFNIGYTIESTGDDLGSFILDAAETSGVTVDDISGDIQQNGTSDSPVTADTDSVEDNSGTVSITVTYSAAADASTGDITLDLTAEQLSDGNTDTATTTVTVQSNTSDGSTDGGDSNGVDQGTVAVGAGTAGVATAQDGPTFVESDITEDTVWTASESPYRIVESISVSDGATLSIEPGVTVESASEVDIDIAGTLITNGKSDDQVRFISAQSTPQAGDWGTIKFSGDADEAFQIEHTVVRHATNGMTISTSEGRIKITATELSDIDNSGVDIENNAAVSISDMSISDSGSGITDRSDQTITNWSIINANMEDISNAGIKLKPRFGDGTVVKNVTIAETSVQNSGQGIIVESEAPFESAVLDDITVKDNKLSDNTGAGIIVRSTSTVQPSEITIVNNSVRNGTGGAVVLGYEGELTTSTVSNNTIINNSGSGIKIGSEGFATATGLSIDSNEVRENEQEGVDISGIDDIDGMKLRKNDVIGNERGLFRFRGGDVAGASIINNTFSNSDREGIYFNTRLAEQSVEGTQISQNSISNNDVGLRFVGYDGLVVLNNSITSNKRQGIRLDKSTSLQINYNIVCGNQEGLTASFPFGIDESTQIDVEHNYWGSESGPAHTSINPEGSGDSVDSEFNTNEIDFIPFLQSPPEGTAQSCEVSDGSESDEIPTDPTERALQITAKSDPSELTQNDVTAVITRFNRGQSVNDVDINQDDVTATITLFERR